MLQSCSSFFLYLHGQPELCGSYHLLQSCFSFFVCLYGQTEPFGSYHFSSLAFLSSSISMTNLSRLVAASFSSLALLSSSVSTTNLSCLLATTFSSLRFLSNSFSSPCFNLLRVSRYFFSLSSVSDDLFFTSCSFFGSPSCSIFFASYPQPFFPLSSSVSEARFALSFLFLSESFFLGFFFVHATAALANS